MDACVPGGVYLCQVNDKVSCGACCGLYNVADIARASLDDRLRRRSLAFARVPRTAEAIERFAMRQQRAERQRRPFDDFHHCPFVGLIGQGLTRIGCLLHPLGSGNRGVDYRGMSYYGGLACRSYFCPTVYQLAPRYKRMVRVLASDWFSYGLIVTEHRLLAALFEQVELGLGNEVSEKKIAQDARAAATLGDLLALKLSWPYRPAGPETLCHYFFKDNLYPRPAIEYARLGCRPSPLDTILTELGSAFDHAEQLRSAEQLVAGKIQAAVQTLSG